MMSSSHRKIQNARAAAVVLSLCLLPAISIGGGEVKYVPPKLPLVQEKLEWFRDQKLCLMMHFGLYSIWGITESWPLSTQDAFWARTDVEWTKDDSEFKRQYFALNKCFNPVRFNAKEIAKTAKRCGFKYVAFTTKHHDGFCLYDTKFTGRGVMLTFPDGFVRDEYADAFEVEYRK